MSNKAKRPSFEQVYEMFQDQDGMERDAQAEIARGKAKKARPTPAAPKAEAGEDLSGLSDEELLRMAGEEGGDEDLSGLSDEELLKLAEENDVFTLEGLGRDVMDEVVVPVGRFVDRYTGAPSRAAVSKAASGGGPKDILSAFWEQLGDEPEKAPTGRDQARKLGVPDTALSDKVPGAFNRTGKGPKLQKGGPLDVTASGAVGFGLDVAEDWTNLVPALAAAKAIGGGAAKIGSKALRMAAQGAGTASDVVTGVKVARPAVESARRATGRAVDAVDGLFNPKRQSDYPRSVAVALQNEVDPKNLSSAVEFGPRSVISRLERVFGEGPLGEKTLKTHDEGARQIQGAMDRRVGKIGGGKVLDEVEAGSLIRSGFDEQARKFFDSIDLTHDEIQKYAPGLYVNRQVRPQLDSLVNGIEKFAKGRVSRGITDTQRGQGKQLLRAVQAYRRGNGTYKQAVEALRDIGEVAFPKKGAGANALADIPPDVDKLRDLYFGINDALILTVRADVNPAFAEELVKNNAAMSQFFKTKAKVADAIGSRSLSDEGVFRNLVLNGDSQKIAALKELLTPEQIGGLKAAFLNSLVKRNADGSFAFDTLFRALQNKKNQVSALFSPDEIGEITDLIKLGRDHGIGVMSTSGTGASNAFRNMLESIPRAVLDESVVGRLKARARGQPLPATDPLFDALREAGVEIPAGLAGPTVKSPLLKSLRRHPMEKRAKALQSVAPSQYEDEKRKRRLKALED